MTPYAIEVTDLTKNFGSVQVLKGVDLRIQEGEIFALLGPNGAGKTTTIEILEGFQKPTTGSVTVLGQNPRNHGNDLKNRIGVVLQSSATEPFLSVEENLTLIRSYYRKPLEVETVLSATGLLEARDQRTSQLSGGFQRRLDVALGLAGDPDLLFLDEPTTGFDPSARREAWEMIRSLRELGKTVLLTTHYMDEVEHLADRAAILVNGRIVTEGSPQELIGQRRTRISFTLDDQSIPLPESLKDRIKQEGNVVEFETDQPAVDLHELTAWALANQQELGSITVGKPTLEDVFVELSSDP